MAAEWRRQAGEQALRGYLDDLLRRAAIEVRRRAVMSSLGRSWRGGRALASDSRAHAVDVVLDLDRERGAPTCARVYGLDVCTSWSRRPTRPSGWRATRRTPALPRQACPVVDGPRPLAASRGVLRSSGGRVSARGPRGCRRRAVDIARAPPLRALVRAAAVWSNACSWRRSGRGSCPNQASGVARRSRATSPRLTLGPATTTWVRMALILFGTRSRGGARGDGFTVSHRSALVRDRLRPPERGSDERFGRSIARWPPRTSAVGARPSPPSRAGERRVAALPPALLGLDAWRPGPGRLRSSRPATSRSSSRAAEGAAPLVVASASASCTASRSSSVLVEAQLDTARWRARSSASTLGRGWQLAAVALVWPLLWGAARAQRTRWRW